MGKEMLGVDREAPCLHRLFERQVRCGHELRDGNAYHDRALWGSVPRRSDISASLFGNYVGCFVNRGWVHAPSGLTCEARKRAGHEY